MGTTSGSISRELGRSVDLEMIHGVTPSGTHIADVLVGAPVVIGLKYWVPIAVRVPLELVSPGALMSPP